jgi:hypothetical protein
MQMQLGEDRLGNFSFQTRRVFVGCALVPCAFSVANYYFEWWLTGTLERGLVAGSFVLLFLVMRYLGPTVQQVRDYRNGHRANSG